MKKLSVALALVMLTLMCICACGTDQKGKGDTPTTDKIEVDNGSAGLKKGNKAPYGIDDYLVPDGEVREETIPEVNPTPAPPKVTMNGEEVEVSFEDGHYVARSSHSSSSRTHVHVESHNGEVTVSIDKQEGNGEDEPIQADPTPAPTMGPEIEIMGYADDSIGDDYHGGVVTEIDQEQLEKNMEEINEMIAGLYTNDEDEDYDDKNMQGDREPLDFDNIDWGTATVTGWESWTNTFKINDDFYLPIPDGWAGESDEAFRTIDFAVSRTPRVVGALHSYYGGIHNPEGNTPVFVAFAECVDETYHYCNDLERETRTHDIIFESGVSGGGHQSVDIYAGVDQHDIKHVMVVMYNTLRNKYCTIDFRACEGQAADAEFFDCLMFYAKHWARLEDMDAEYVTYDDVFNRFVE